MTRAWTGFDDWNYQVHRTAHIGGIRDDIAGGLMSSNIADRPMPHRLRAWERVIFTCLGVVLAALLMVAYLFISPHPAWGHDASRPDRDEWYRSLQSGKGPCCGPPSVDATILEGAQWRTSNGTYEVFIDGEWVIVPESAVVQVPNVDGRALVWIFHYDGHPRVRCFMPGTLS